MRIPLLALGLAVTAGLGATPVAGALAATTNPTSTTRSTSTTPGSSPQTTTPVHTTNAVSGAQIIQTAIRYLGYPYTTTGNSPQTGFSCIGFVSFVYRSNGIPLPGDLSDAMAFAPQVPLSQLQPGDILFFQNTIWTGLSHTAIYLGGGRFIHAEWYNRGVVISSFNDDKVDGNYWIGKYLGANRPWGGASVTPVITTPPSGSSAVGPHPVTSTPSHGAFNGPAAAVTVPLLNVRVGPSKNAAVRQVIPQGTNVVILGKSHGWYKVQLPDGTIGWIVKAGVATSAPATSTQAVSQTQATQPTVGTPTQPQVQGTPTHSVHTAMSTVRVSGLNVHSGPSLTDQIVTVAARGQKLEVLARRNGWLEVRTPSGVVGWVKASLTSSGKRSGSRTPPTPPTYSSVKPTHVQRVVSKALTTGPRLTAGVRVHVAPALSARVVTTAAAGTHVRILGYTGSWTLVRLPSGTTGYVFGAYIHR
jgi:cell wall-associated NlpC family hydrolase/uncharacterized protein YgiM (DUF1202 family)